MKLTTPEKNYYVITGGPGVGKTSLLNALAQAGHQVVAEDARKIIKSQMAISGDALPWKNKLLYAELMFKAAVNAYKDTEATKSIALTFFDRGIWMSFATSRWKTSP
jgi:predicted ATPase